MLHHSSSIIEPGSRGFMVWRRSQAIRWKIWAKYRPRLKRASSAAEKRLIRKEKKEEFRLALEAEGLHHIERDPQALY